MANLSLRAANSDVSPRSRFFNEGRIVVEALGRLRLPELCSFGMKEQPSG